MKTKQLLQRFIDYGLIATLFVFPLVINISLISPSDPGHPLIAVNVSLADLIIGIVLALWILKILLFKEWEQIRLPQAPFFVFIGIGMLSFVNAFSITQWLKEFIQMIEYFLLFYVLLINNLHAIKITILKNSLFISATIILIVAFIQHTFLQADPYFVKGLFENRNIMGAFLCMTVPLVYVELVSTDRIFKKIWMGAMLLVSYFVLVSGSALLSIMISLVIISLLYSKKVFARLLAVTLLLAVVYPFVMPAKNIHTIREFSSIYEQGSISENYYRRLTLLGDLDKNILFKNEIGDNFLQISSENFMSVVMPEIQKGERYKEMEGKKQIKNRYLEMQASINMLSRNTLLGVGLGNYQNYIGTYYNGLPKVNTSEPHQNNGYLVIAGTTGVLGLSALLWLFFSLLTKVNIRYKSSEKNKYILLGLMGSIIACMVENIFCSLIVAGLMLPFIFLLSLISKKS